MTHSIDRKSQGHKYGLIRDLKVEDWYPVIALIDQAMVTRGRLVIFHGIQCVKQDGRALGVLQIAHAFKIKDLSFSEGVLANIWNYQDFLCHLLPFGVDDRDVLEVII